MRSISEDAAWLTLAHRSALKSAEQMHVALADGPKAATDDMLADARALRDLGVRLLTIREYPERLRTESAPVVLQVAGRASLLDEEGVNVLAGQKQLRDPEQRSVVVLSKGLLQARRLLKALHEPIADGTIALVSAEPPRARWGPVRDLRRDALVGLLRH